MFPSPIGELHFSIDLTKTVEIERIVSVPYRGATFLNCSQILYCISDTSFPSPIGELHFSMNYDVFNEFRQKSFRPLSGSYISQLTDIRRNGLAFDLFPSPIGELHFSIVAGIGTLENAPIEFPSPIGELHFSMTFPLTGGEKRWNRFRPLSGSYISQYLNTNHNVPSSLFPSPIGELHFSIGETLQDKLDAHKVSVPYRGATFLNTIPATPCPVWDE